MANSKKHYINPEGDFRSGVAAARKAMRETDRAIKALNKLPVDVPAAGPDVQIPVAEGMVRAAGELSPFQRGFVTYLAEMAFQNVLGFCVDSGWLPYCAQSARSVEMHRRRYSLDAKEDAELDALYTANRWGIEAGKVIVLANARAKRGR